jgi:hypothetical protein
MLNSRQKISKSNLFLAATLSFNFLFSAFNIFFAISVALVPIFATFITIDSYDLLNKQEDILNRSNFTRFGRVDGENFILPEDPSNLYIIYEPTVSLFRTTMIPIDFDSATFLPRSLWLESVERGKYDNSSILNPNNVVEGEWTNLRENEIAVSTDFAKNYDLGIGDQLFYYPSLVSEPLVYQVHFVFSDFLFTLSTYPDFFPYNGILFFGENHSPQVTMNQTDYLYFGVKGDAFVSNTELIFKEELILQIQRQIQQLTIPFVVLYTIIILVHLVINLTKFSGFKNLLALRRIHSPKVNYFIFLEFLMVVWLSLILNIGLSMFTSLPALFWMLLLTVFLFFFYALIIRIYLDKQFIPGGKYGN